jgi:transposase
MACWLIEPLPRSGQCLSSHVITYKPTAPIRPAIHKTCAPSYSLAETVLQKIEDFIPLEYEYNISLIKLVIGILNTYRL